MRSFFLAAAVYLLCAFSAQAAHGISVFGDLKYPPDFDHFDYANPDAPKGGVFRDAAIGSFDSLNPFILKGKPASGVQGIYDTLMESSADEPLSKYGLIAESVELAPDKGSVTFTLRPEAKFHDGHPITADDVVFSFDTLTKHGHPFYRTYYHDVLKAEALDEHTVRFTFATTANRELPLIVGELPVLPKHYWQGRDFSVSSLDIPLGSGPYRVIAVDAGKSITYQRVPDYWGKDLPVNKGRHNFDRMIVEYYRDASVAMEAFKAGRYDFRQENVARNWAMGYTFPAVSRGHVKVEEIPHDIPTGMQAFAMNTRREIFADARVRQALTLAFDFEWSNATLFHGAYSRTDSYFSNSIYASSGMPTAEEMALLEPFRDSLPPEIFTQSFSLPASDGKGFNRENLLKARDLLKEAGYVVRDKKLVNATTGKPLEIEFLLSSSNFERIVSPYLRNLERLGIRARIRTVDASQYQTRLEQYDFDIIVHVYGQSLFPGNEQRNYWTSEKADQPGGQNYIGIKNPAVDAMVEKIISAHSMEELTTATHALDRVLLWNYYAIPQWHVRTFRVAYWDKFAKPAIAPKYGLGLDTWWSKNPVTAVDNAIPLMLSPAPVNTEKHEQAPAEQKEPEAQAPAEETFPAEETPAPDAGVEEPLPPVEDVPPEAVPAEAPATPMPVEEVPQPNVETPEAAPAAPPTAEQPKVENAPASQPAEAAPVKVQKPKQSAPKAKKPVKTKPDNWNPRARGK